MEIKQNLTFFHGKCSNLESFLISRKIFQFNCISEHKQVKKKIKSNDTCANLTECFLIYKVLRYLNDLKFIS